MESEAVAPPERKTRCLVLDEGHHLPDVARDALEMSAEITAPGFRLQLDLFCKLVATVLDSFSPENHAAAWPIRERLTARVRKSFRADCLVE